jgi:thiamine transporter ThiT
VEIKLIFLAFQSRPALIHPLLAFWMSDTASPLCVSLLRHPARLIALVRGLNAGLLIGVIHYLLLHD